MELRQNDDSRKNIGSTCTMFTKHGSEPDPLCSGKDF